MLTACTEGGRAKSYRYWPERVGEKLIFSHRVTSEPVRPHHTGDWVDGYLPPITVEYVSSEASSEADAASGKGWRTNILRLSQEGRKPVEIRQIEYLGWQDHGVPESPEEVLRLLEYLNSLPGADTEPIVTHCSAGVGRTGTFISIAWLIPLLKRLRDSPDDPTVFSGLEQRPEAYPLGPLPPVPASGNIKIDEFDPIMAVIDGCRDQRTTMVQTNKQVEFVYEVARTYWIAEDRH